MLTEAKITRQTKKFLELTEREFKPHFWFYKVSDKYTSGLPDYHGLAFGVPFYIELKATGKKPRKLQRYIILRIKNAGGKVLATDDFEEVKKFISSEVLTSPENPYFLEFDVPLFL